MSQPSRWRFDVERSRPSAPPASFPVRAVSTACILTAAGGFLDAWTYIAHGHVFANAQTGNIVLFAIHMAAGEYGTALNHVPSMLAFCGGLVASRVGGTWIKRGGANSRTHRLGLEALCLILLAAVATHVGDVVVTAAVGFIAAVQVTAFSHVGTWSFNTGMTTGNLRSAFSAASAVWTGSGDDGERARAFVLASLCVAFLVGAVGGAAATLRFGNLALLGAAATVLLAVAVGRSLPDPVA